MDRQKASAQYLSVMSVMSELSAIPVLLLEAYWNVTGTKKRITLIIADLHFSISLFGPPNKLERRKKKNKEERTKEEKRRK